MLLETKAAASHERRATVELVALLAQLDVRRLYLGEGCSSLFTYCTQVLHLSEHAAYGRIEAARAAVRFPIVLELVGEGALTLTAVTLLAPHLTDANHREVVDAARHKTKREVEHIVVRLRPQPPVATTLRKLSSPSMRDDGDDQPTLQQETQPSIEATCSDPMDALWVRPQRPPVIAPLAPERYKLQFTMSHETHDKLRRAQDLLRHSIPNGDPAAIFDRALTLLLTHLERTKCASTARLRVRRRTSSRSRHIPAAVRREVWERDGGQCAFVGTQGRCTERGFLEYHHVAPYVDGGSGSATNIQLRCRAHNVYEAELLGLLVREHAPRYHATRSGPSGLVQIRIAALSRLPG